jgi:hypothetical protein
VAQIPNRSGRVNSCKRFFAAGHNAIVLRETCWGRKSQRKRIAFTRPPSALDTFAGATANCFLVDRQWRARKLRRRHRITLAAASGCFFRSAP